MKALSIYRLPVQVPLLVKLLGEPRKESAFRRIATGDVGIRASLARLRSRRLVSLLQSNGATTCMVHPAVRDHFYRAMGKSSRGYHAEVIQQFASLLEIPHRAPLLDPASLDMAEELIYHSLRCGQSDSAVQFYEGAVPYEQLGWTLADYQRGLRVTSLFTSDGDPSLHAISTGTSPWHDNALYLMDLGRPAEAEKRMRELLSWLKHKRAVTHRRPQDVSHSRHDNEDFKSRYEERLFGSDEDTWLLYEGILYQCLFDALILQGKLVEAECVINSVVTECDRRLGKERSYLSLYQRRPSGSNVYGRRATVRYLLGAVEPALEDFSGQDQGQVGWAISSYLYGPSIGGIHSINHSRLLIHMGQFRLARATLNQIQNTALRRPLLQAHFDLAMGEIDRLEGNPAAGLREAENVLPWAMQSGHQEGYALGLLLKARSLVQLHLYDDALEAATEVESMARRSGQALFAAEGMLAHGHADLELENLHRADEYAQQVYHICIDDSCRHKAGVGSALHLRASVAFRKGAAHAARRLGNEALAVRTEIQDRRLQNTKRLLRDVAG